MDILSLFSGSDNLYKHLFIGGLGMIILSLFYPLEKEFLLNTQKDNYNKEIRLLNIEISELKKKALKLEEEGEPTIKSAQKYAKKKSKYAKKLSNNIIDTYQKNVADVISERKQIDIKQANINYSEDCISTLEKHINSYRTYRALFLWSGSLFMIVGIGGWWYMTHKKKQTEPR